MKKFKKILALALSLAMVLGMGVTSFAETTSLKGSVPSNKDTGKITVTGLQEGDTVNIYKIVKANYTTDGFIGYEAVHSTDIETLEAPTAEEIAAVLAHIQAEDPDHSNCDEEQDTASATVAKDSTQVEFADLKVGTYLVVVTAGNGSTTVYNPMVASVYYVTEGTTDKIEQGTVDAGSNWDISGDIVYAKSSNDNDITKTIVGSDRAENSTGYGKGDDVAKDTTVSFAIEGTIPSYNKEYYTNPVYTITDTLSDGLDFVTVEADEENGVKAKTAQQVLQEKADEIFGANNSTVTVNGRTFTLTLTSDCLYTLAGKPAENETPDDAAKNDRTFKFVYSAVVNGTAYNFDPSTNTAKVTYSNKPSTSGDAGTTTGEDHKTYHYTFAIGAQLSESSELITKTTNIIQKVDEDGNILSTDISEFEDKSKYIEVASGAMFELKLNDSTKDVSYTATSDENGELNFTGLDAGTYTLKEIKAPAGYSLSNDTHDVVIATEYYDNGQLKNLKITIDDQPVTVFTATYESDGAIKEINGEPTITSIKNTKLSTLPSTGGIGTTIFTIGGCAIMILAAGLYFATRRKSAK